MVGVQRCVAGCVLAVVPLGGPGGLALGVSVVLLGGYLQILHGAGARCGGAPGMRLARRLLLWLRGPIQWVVTGAVGGWGVKGRVCGVCRPVPM